MVPGVQGKNNEIQNLYQVRFLMKGKKSKLFLYWVSHKCCERGKTKFLFNNNKNNIEKSHRYGLPEDFLSKGQKG